MNPNMRSRIPLVLASTSPSRHSLLQRLKIPFTVIAPDVDETAQHEEMPQQLVTRLAVAKARAGAAKIQGRALIIGSDQVAYFENMVIGKPGSRAKAIAQLEKFSGKKLEFYNGLCVLDTSNGNLETACVPCVVKFRSLSLSQIENYVDLEPAFNCAGSFKSEGLGIALFESIKTDDPTSLIGLPLIKLISILERFGVSLFNE